MNRRAWIPVLGVLAGLCAAAPPAGAESMSFTSPGSFSFTVPNAVGSVHVIAIGASGATPPVGGAGGHGARVSGDLAVTPGQKLFIGVGAVGAGGGASHIASSATNPSARLIVAGGGGGGGRNGEAPGGGGGVAGADGGGGGAGGAGPGLAGGSNTGGDGGIAVDGFGGDDGVLGAGGDGGLGVDRDSGGGGGGGGWYGGGGGGGCGFACAGGAGGGGGGSNHAGSRVTGFQEQVATSTGDGSVELFWTEQPEPPPESPSNDFTIGKPAKNKKRGTATLPVDVPGAGDVELAASGKVNGASETAGAAAEVTLPVKAAGKARRKLKTKGRAKVTVEVTFTPDGGVPNTESAPVKLVRKK